MSNVNAVAKRPVSGFGAKNSNCVACLRKGRVFGALLVALAAAVFAVGLVSFPGSALAEESVKTLTQSDFDNASKKGIYSIDGGGSYRLGSDITGAIDVVSLSSELTIDLNGKTLTCSTDIEQNAAIQISVYGTDHPAVTIKNGTIVQERDGGDGVDIWRTRTSVTLEDLSVSVTNGFCVDANAYGSSLTIRRGNYKVTKSNPDADFVSAVVAHLGAVTVDQYDATFTIDGGDNVVMTNGGTISLKGGKFNKFPSQASIYGGYAMAKTDSADATWDVKEEEAARNSVLNGGASAGYAVAVDGFGTVYFSSEDEAKAFAEDRGTEVTTAAVAKVGETYYSSLKAAVNAAASDSTVELLQDTEDNVTVDGKSLMIDLGGHTLTSPDTREAITKKGAGTLNVCNGTISTKLACVSSTSSNVTLTNVKATSSSRYAVDASGSGSVTIESGEFASVDDDYEAVRVSGSALLTINGGSFSGARGVDIYCQSSKTPSVSGGDFSNTKPITYLADGHSMQYQDGRYYVVDTSDNDKAAAVKAQSGWALVAKDGQRVYYSSSDKSQAEGDQAGLSGSALKKIFRVTFNDYEGEEVATQSYVDGETIAALPNAGERSGYTFLGWYNGETKADTDTTVSADVTYTAKWELSAVAQIGSNYYDSLQDAVNAANAGDTVLLLKETTENVTVNKSCDEFTIDLNDNTLSTNSIYGNALTINGSSKVVIKNGSITNSGACVGFANGSQGARATLCDGLRLTTSGGHGKCAVSTAGGNSNTVVIEGGTYTCDGGMGVWCVGTSNSVEIKGGEFKAAVAALISWGKAKISGGQFSGGIAVYNSANLTITGGRFMNDFDIRGVPSIAISGGNFSSQNLLRYVIDGYVMQPSEEAGHYEVVRDSTPPVISGIAAGATYEGTKTFTVSDQSSVTVKVGDVILTPDSSGKYTLSEATLGDLEGDLTVTATDAADNQTSVTVQWYKGHSWSEWSHSDDGTKHVRTCSHCGQTESGAHEGGTATCVSKAVCNVCGLEYGEKDATNHAGTESTTWSSDGSSHWHECSECHEAWGDKTAHSFAWVRDKEPGYDVAGHEVYKCSVCGYVSQERDIDPLDPEAPVISGISNGGCYDEAATTFTVSYQGTGLVVTANGATLTPVDGTYTLPNSGANVVVVAKGDSGKTTSITVSSYAAHEWGSWQSNADGTHVRACTHVACSGTETSTCSGDAATCVSASYCKDCGYKIADVDPDNHDGHVSEMWSADGEKHWHECTECHAHVDEDEHDFEAVSDGESGHHLKCKVCGYATEAEGHDFEFVSDGESGHHQECKICGYATEAAEHDFETVSDGESGHHQECKDCGYEAGTVEHELAWRSDGDQHWQECEGCGYATERSDHDLELAYEDETGHWHECPTCGYEDKDGKQAHTLVWVVTKQATATEDGLKHQECSECGYRGADVVIPKTGGDGSDDDKGGSDKGDGSKDGSGSSELPQTGDVALVVSGIAAAGAALTAFGLRRRK